MSEYRYEMRWPREAISLEAFAHDIFNYNYHWHLDEYELNILLGGSQKFCCGTGNFTLAADDVLLVSPGVGHASFAQEPNTRALVIHFSASVFKPYLPKGQYYIFSHCRSEKDSRNNEDFRMIRFCAAQIYESLSSGGSFAALTARAGLEELMSALCRRFEPQPAPTVGDKHGSRELMGHLVRYMEQHYAEKLTLEDLAAYAQYNRTYVSTLFKNTVGVNFYEYLTRLRFQNALFDIASSEKKLTEIALDNGFADLKSFNKRFRETLGCSPAEYRALLSPERVNSEHGLRRYVSPDDAIVREKIKCYLHPFAD